MNNSKNSQNVAAKTVLEVKLVSAPAAETRSFLEEAGFGRFRSCLDKIYACASKGKNLFILQCEDFGLSFGYFTLIAFREFSWSVIDEGWILSGENRGDRSRFGAFGHKVPQWNFFCRSASPECLEAHKSFLARKKIPIFKESSAESRVENLEEDFTRTRLSDKSDGDLPPDEVEKPASAPAVEEHQESSPQAKIPTETGDLIELSHMLKKESDRGVDEKELAHMLPAPVRTVRDLLKLNDLHPDLWPLIDAPMVEGNRISIAQGAALSCLPRQMQAKVWNDIQRFAPQGLIRKEVERLLRDQPYNPGKKK